MTFLWKWTAWQNPDHETTNQDAGNFGKIYYFHIIKTDTLMWLGAILSIACCELVASYSV